MTTGSTSQAPSIVPTSTGRDRPLESELGVYILVGQLGQGSGK
jgi:hypothetical protein